MSCMASPWKHPDSGIYYLRVGVPKDIREQICKSVIKYSLNTRDLKEAKRLFASGYAETQALFQQARDKVTLSAKDIDALSQRWLQAALDHVEDSDEFSAYLAHSSDGEVSSASHLIADALERGYKAQLGWVKPHIEQVLSDNNVLLTEGSPEYIALTERMCWRLMDFSRIVEDRHYGNWDTEPNVSKRLAGHKLPTEKTELTYKPLSRIIQEFTAYKTDRGDWEGKTLRDPVAVYEQFLEFIGDDVDPNTISRDRLREFIALLHQLPQRYTIIPRLKKKTLSELVEIAADEELPLLSPTTVKKKFVFIKSLFKHAAQEEWIERDRAAGITVKPGKSKKRVPYREEELQTIFNATRDAEKPSDFWCPRIAATTGMRSNEILQLTKDDVKQAAGVWFFDVNTAIDAESGKDKKAKTENSERKVPVPQVLIDAGFIKFVESVESGRLFPCVALAAADGTYSFTYSKRFNPLLKRLGLKPDPDEMVIKDFHSFRHTFRSNARAYGIPKEIAELIGGWKSQDDRTAGDDYGLHYDAFIAELKASIDKIDYTDITF